VIAAGKRLERNEGGIVVEIEADVRRGLDLRRSGRG
jgi:hypothetical protein